MIETMIVIMFLIVNYGAGFLFFRRNIIPGSLMSKLVLIPGFAVIAITFTLFYIVVILPFISLYKNAKTS